MAIGDAQGRRLPPQFVADPLFVPKDDDPRDAVLQ
jgi:hypothetical protein